MKSFSVQMSTQMAIYSYQTGSKPFLGVINMFGVINTVQMSKPWGGHWNKQMGKDPAIFCNPRAKLKHFKVPGGWKTYKYTAVKIGAVKCRMT